MRQQLMMTQIAKVVLKFIIILFLMTSFTYRKTQHIQYNYVRSLEWSSKFDTVLFVEFCSLQVVKCWRLVCRGWNFI